MSPKLSPPGIKGLSRIGLSSKRVEEALRGVPQPAKTESELQAEEEEFAVTKIPHRVFSSDEAKELGLNIKEGWMLKIFPLLEDPDVLNQMLISPEGIEVSPEDVFETPEGEWLIKSEVDAAIKDFRTSLAGTKEAREEVSMLGRVLSEVFPMDRDKDSLIDWALSSEENLSLFLEQIWSAGRSPDTEAFVQFLFSDITPAEMDAFWATEKVVQIPELGYDVTLQTETGEDIAALLKLDANTGVTNVVIEGQNIGTYDPDTGQIIPFTPIEMAVSSRGEAAQTFVDEVPGFDSGLPFDIFFTKQGRDYLLATLGVGGAYVHKYVMLPWESMVLDARAEFQIAIGLGTDADREFQKAHWDIVRKYGYPAAFFADDYNAAFEAYLEKTPQPLRGLINFTEWLNPAWFIPIGGTFGWGAKVTTKIPIIGKGAEGVAAVVQGLERGLVFPIAKPLELIGKGGIKGLEKLGERLSTSYAERVIKESKNLEVLLELPTFDKDIAGSLVDNWQRTAIQILSKAPPVRWGVEKGLGWRILVNRESKAIRDILGRANVGYGVMERRGINAAVMKTLELRSILPNPIKYFGFGKNAFSSKMFNRLLPQYAAEREVAGTLEHIFTKPEMYNWSRMDKGLQYVTRVHETNTLVTNLLIKEGVPPKVVLEDWIHRVVEGVSRDGELVRVRGKLGVRGGGRVGAKPSYEMKRKAPTMAEGISWGIQYSRNPEVSVGTFIEEAFRKIAGSRSAKYLEPFGVLPSERLVARFPEVVEKALLTKTELADAAHFGSVINRAIRGEKLPEGTLRALESRFPDLGRKFRGLAQEPAQVEKQLRELLSQNEKIIRGLRRRLEKAEAVDVAAIRAEARAEAIRVGIPDEQKLREAFKLMDFEDRAAFRSTMQGQIDEIGQVVFEQEAERKGIMEILKTDPIAQFHGVIGKKRVPLTSVLVKGTFPESFSVKEAQMLMMGRKPKTIVKGRVPREVVVDELADHFKMTEQQLIDRIEYIYEQRILAADLNKLVTMANSRNQDIKRMLKIIDDVDAVPDYVPNLEAEKLAIARELQVDVAGKISRLESELTQAGREVTPLQAHATKMGWSDARYLEELRKVIGRVRVRGEIPKAEAGMPEAGIQKDLFGFETPYFPKGKGEVVQVSYDDWIKLIERRKEAGLPAEPPNIAIKPKVEGVKGLEAESQMVQVRFEPPAIKSTQQRVASLKKLRTEVKAITEARKAPYWQARTERALRMEQVRQPEVGEGFIMQPFAGGRIYTDEFRNEFNKFFGHDAGLGVLRVTSDTAGLLRIVKAALDLSYPVIQGTLSWGLAHSYLMLHPKIGVRMTGAWYSTFAQQVGAFFNPNILYKWMAKNEASIMQRVNAGGSMRAAFLFQEMKATVGQGAIARMGENLLAKIPLKPYQRAEWAFFTGGELLRDKFWQILSPKALARGEGRQLARFLDLLTGLADPRAMGVPMTVRQIEQSFIFFSGAYTRSYLTIVAEIFRGGFTGAQAREAIAGFIGAGAAYFTGVQYAINQLEGKSEDETWDTIREGYGVHIDPLTGETEWRPTSRFMSLKIGDSFYGVGGGIYGLMRLLSNITATARELGDREIIDFIRITKNGELNRRDNPFINWWYNRSSALTSPIYEMWQGRDFLGYPIEGWDGYIKYMLTLFEPIWIEQGINPLIPQMARDNEIPENNVDAALRVAGEFFGLRVNPEYSWDKVYRYVNETVIPKIDRELFSQYFPPEEIDKILTLQSEGNLRWQHLPDQLQMHLRVIYPDLDEVWQNAQADSALRNSNEWKQWTEATDGAKQTYYERGDTLIDRVKTGDLNTRELREHWSDAGSTYGTTLNTIEQMEVFQAIYNRFAKLEEKGEKYDQMARLALAEYNSIMFTEYLDENGEPDWDIKDAEVEAYIGKWGEDTYQLIRRMYAEKRLLAGMNPLLIKLSDDKDRLGREYWQTPYKPIYEMDEDDELEGNIPAEHYSLWKQYQALVTDAERDAFLERNPDMRRDWRAEYRLNNPESDAMLAFWGYSGKIQSREAYDLLLGWSQEFNVPLEGLGLGLPPPSLVDKYFGYGELLTKYSAGSADAKLWRLENPKFNDWAMDNWGWAGTEDYKAMDYYKIQIKWRAEQADYDALQTNYARGAFLEEHPEFRDDRRRLQAMDLGLAGMPLEKGFIPERVPLVPLEDIMAAFRSATTEEEAYKSLDAAVGQYGQLKVKDTLSIEELTKWNWEIRASDWARDGLLIRLVSWGNEFWKVFGWLSGEADLEQLERIKRRVPDFIGIVIDKLLPIYQSEPSDKFPEKTWDEVLKLAVRKYGVAELINLVGQVGVPNQWERIKLEIEDKALKNHMEAYVFYYNLPSTGYDQERYLKENTDYYNDVWLGVLGNKKKDFSKVPSVKVESLYTEWQKLPIGSARREFEALHTDLDQWLHLKFGTKLESERNKVTPKEEPPEEETTELPELPELPVFPT